MLPIVIQFLNKTIQILEHWRYKWDIQYRNATKDAILNDNSFLKQCKNGKCYVLGNSPSLNKHDLLRLENESVFCVNTFFVHDNFDTIKPNFYVIADPDLFNLEDEATKDWWAKMIEKSRNKGIVFFFPLQLKNTFVHEAFKKEQVCFLDLSLHFNSKSVNDFDISNPINGVQNVLVLCIQLAIYMGFDEINLVGADHDWLSHYGSEQRHFYNTEKAKIQNVGSGGYPYNWWLNAVNTMFLQYKALEHFASQKNIKIYNASESGVLDVFPFISYKDSFKNE